MVKHVSSCVAAPAVHKQLSNVFVDNLSLSVPLLKKCDYAFSV